MASGGSFALLVIAAGLVATIVGTQVTVAGPVVGIAAPHWTVKFGIPVLRTLLDLSAVAVAGLGLLSKLVGFDRPDRTEAVVGRARRLAVRGSAIWGISALLSIVLLSAELDPGRPPTPASVWNYVANIAAGKGLLMSAGCALLSYWLSRVAVRHGEKVPAELRIGIALFGLLPLPLTGHAANWYYHDLSMVSMELHVVAATAWTGGLAAVVIFLGRKPTLLAAALPRFSKLATWCVFVVAVTGILNGLLELALSPSPTYRGRSSPPATECCCWPRPPAWSSSQFLPFTCVRGLCRRSCGRNARLSRCGPGGRSQRSRSLSEWPWC